MDPSQLQADKSNDVHSLEQSDGTDNAASTPSSGEIQETTSADGQTKVTDASGEAPGTAKPPADDKPSFFRRTWERLNIYLVLFVLIIVVAIGVLAITTVRSRNTTEVALNPQGLSPGALEELANTDVTVGDAKQILTVQSNAVFAGSVLVRSNMEVAGAVKVGGAVSLTELNVTGTSKLRDVQAENLTVGSNMNLQGSLSVKNGLSVSGNSSFTGSVVVGALTTGSLTLNGDLRLTHHITAGGTIPAIDKGSAVGGGGTVSLSGSDTGGSIVINTGSTPPAGCFATIKFSESFATTPHVVLTPVGSGAAELNYYITRSTTEFVVCSANPAPGGQTFGFDYIIFA